MKTYVPSALANLVRQGAAIEDVIEYFTAHGLQTWQVHKMLFEHGMHIPSKERLNHATDKLSTQ